ncbi:hypothetical protein A2U01_0116548, partial [Trifolium medium]|nr:hypothetical protein [Trifolium medium]
NDINDDLNKIQNGDINELIKFQKSTREWVQELNEEFEFAQLKKKNRLSEILFLAGQMSYTMSETTV